MTPTEASQDWLAMEHQAVWFYPVIGARFDAQAGSARRSYDSHRAVRDTLLARLRGIGVEPASPALAYDVGSLRTKALARAAALDLEQQIAAACLTLVGVSEGDERTFATAALRRAALAELSWGGRPTAFPGLPS